MLKKVKDDDLKNKTISYLAGKKMGLFGNSRELQLETKKLLQNHKQIRRIKEKALL